MFQNCHQFHTSNNYYGKWTNHEVSNNFFHAEQEDIK